ncbi:hypothetical protein JCM10207_006691 [Rhodosporidiobolus poonsookiae]
MASSDDTDAFFTRDRTRITTASTFSAPRPSKRRKSSHDPDDSSSSASSDDLQHLTSARKTKSASKRKATAPQPLSRASATKGKGRGRVKEIALDDSSDEDDAESHAGPSSTQLEEGNDVLRQLARDNGAHVSTPPRRAKQAAAKAVASSSRRTGLPAMPDDSDDSDGTTSRSRRRTSASTAQTSLTDRSSSASKGKKRAAAGSTAKPKKAPAPRKKRRSAAGDDGSVSPQLEQLDEDALEQPPPPVESFWGVDPKAAAPKPAKPKIGERSALLKQRSEERTLEQQRAMLVLPSEEGEVDEIAVDSSEGEQEKYELTAAKAKRQRSEGIAKLKATRAQGRLPLQPAPNNASPFGSPKPKDKGKGKAVEPLEECMVCKERFPPSALQAHVNSCLDGAADAEDDLFDLDLNLDHDRRTPTLEATDPKPPPPPVASTSRATAFRPAASKPTPARQPAPASAARSARRPSPAPQAADDLAAALFPSSPPVARKAPPAPRPSEKDKGKGKARAPTLVEDSDEEPDEPPPRRRNPSPPPEDDFDGLLDTDFDFDPGADDAPPGRGGEEEEDNDLDATLHKTVVIVDSDDDDDDEPVIVAGPSRGGGGGAAGGGTGTKRKAARGAGAAPGFSGAVNAERNPGPPQDGSSPPRGSLYLSTMSRAFKEGYTQMYSRSTTGGGANSRGRKTPVVPIAGNYDPDDDAAAFEAEFAVPKTTAGRSGRGGRGGRARGGARKTSWGRGRVWRGRGRKSK